MTTLTQDVQSELIARIAFRENTIETWSASTNLPATVKVTALSNTGFAWFDIAACRLMLDDSAGSLEAFKEAAQWTYAALELMSPPSIALYSGALESAVMSDDSDLTHALASNPVAAESKPSLLADRLDWALALPALIQSDDDQAKRHAASAINALDKKAWYPGIGDAVIALTAGDGPALAAALERMLEKHKRYARAERSTMFNSARAFICVPAVVLLRLATWRGIRVPGLEAGLTKMPFALVHSVPPPPQKTTIEIDFIPQSLFGNGY